MPKKFHGQRSPVGCIVPGATKSQTQLSTMGKANYAQVFNSKFTA